MAGDSVQDFSKILGVVAKVRNLVPDFTVSQCLRAVMKKRFGEGGVSIDGKTAAGKEELVETEAGLIANFGVRIKQDDLPGFSRCENMAAIVSCPNEGLLSDRLHEQICKGMDMMETLMCFLASTFSCSTAPNFFFDPTTPDYSTKPSSKTDSKDQTTTGANKMLFGVRHESAFQIQNGTYGIRSDLTETEACDEYAEIHEENYGLSIFADLLTSNRVGKNLVMRVDDDNNVLRRARFTYSRPLKFIIKRTNVDQDVIYQVSSSDGPQAR